MDKRVRWERISAETTDGENKMDTETGADVVHVELQGADDNVNTDDSLKESFDFYASNSNELLFGNTKTNKAQLTQEFAKILTFYLHAESPFNEHNSYSNIVENENGDKDSNAKKNLLCQFIARKNNIDDNDGYVKQLENDQVNKIHKELTKFWDIYDFDYRKCTKMIQSWMTDDGMDIIDETKTYSGGFSGITMLNMATIAMKENDEFDNILKSFEKQLRNMNRFILIKNHKARKKKEKEKELQQHHKKHSTKRIITEGLKTTLLNKDSKNDFSIETKGNFSHMEEIDEYETHLKAVETKDGMIHYLNVWKKDYEMKHNLHLRWEKALEEINGGGNGSGSTGSGKMDKMQEWDWPYVVWWLQCFEQFNDYNIVTLFGKYHINGKELMYLTVKQIVLLFQIEYNIDDDTNISFPNAYDDSDVDSDENENEHENETRRNDVKNNNGNNNNGDSNDRRSINDDFRAIATAIVNEIRKHRIHALFEKYYQCIWSQLIDISRNSKETIDYTNGIERKQIELREIASSVIDIVDSLRAEPNVGPLAFWKGNSVFFNKIDNFLAILLIPKTLQVMMKLYFPDYLLEPIEDMSNFDTNTNTNINTNINIPPSQPSSIIGTNDNLNKHGKYRKKTTMFANPANFAKPKLEEICDELKSNIALKDYEYEYQTYLQCITGEEIINYLANKYLSRRRGIFMANKLIANGFLIQYDPFNSDNSNTSTSSYSGASRHSTAKPVIKAGATQFFTFIGSDSSHTPHLSKAGLPSSYSIGKLSTEQDKKDSEQHAIELVKQRLFRFCWIPSLVLFLGVAIGASGLITWYDLRTDWQIDEAMKEWTVDSIEKRVHSSLEYEFSIAQSILTITISGLYTGDIPTDESINNGSYDRYFAAFSQYSHSNSISYVAFYNMQDDLYIGARRDTSRGDGDEDLLQIMLGEDECYHEEYYNTTTQTRIGTSRRNCTPYNQSSREWYKLITSVE